MISRKSDALVLDGVLSILGSPGLSLRISSSGNDGDSKSIYFSPPPDIFLLNPSKVQPLETTFSENSLVVGHLAKLSKYRLVDRVYVIGTPV